MSETMGVNATYYILSHNIILFLCYFSTSQVYNFWEKVGFPTFFQVLSC